MVLSRENRLPLSPVLCAVTGLSRATVHRLLRAQTAAEAPAPASDDAFRCTGPRFIDAAQREVIFEMMCAEEYVDLAPAEIYFRELDAGRYPCSIRTMYRILKEKQAVGERRPQRRHMEYRKPELLATAPNQVWSLDITRLQALEKWTYYYLYVVMDIYSRLVVGWMIAEHETGANLQVLLQETLQKQDIGADQLKVHSDRGSPMKTLALAQLLADLNVAQSFSRPHTSNDNPFSESQFRTTKYHWSYPGKFPDIATAIAWARKFFPWFNEEHRHSGLNYLTPHQVHYGLYAEVLEQRKSTLQAAFTQHPERFVNGVPKVLPPPPAVGINWPQTQPTAASDAPSSKADSKTMEVDQ